MLTMILMMALGTQKANASTLPLESSHYDVRIVGGIAEIELEQVFSNTASDFIEAVYTFPLDGGSAVDDMTIEVDGREIVGVIKARDEARKEYELAREQGRTAALTEQERGNVFTQSVANIPPGERIRVRLHAVQPVDRSDHQYELVIPLVVGPRFSPVAEVPDANAVTPPVSRQDTGVSVDIDVELNMGLPIHTLDSPTHAEELHIHHARQGVSVTDIQPNSDFVIRWSVDTDEPVAIALEQDDHIMLRFEAPEVPRADSVLSREIIWIIDTSGSQEGLPLEMAQSAVLRGLETMNDNDRFGLIQFANQMSQFENGLVNATDVHIARAMDWVRNLRAGGGTNMVDAVYGALNIPEDTSRERYVVMVTDGLIGNERGVLASIADHLGPARLFTFGLGNGTNRWLLEEMALEGGGRATFVTGGEDPEATVQRFMEGIEKPLLSDLVVDWGDWSVDAVHPAKLGDLMAGQPMEVLARTTGGSGPIRVRGRQAGKPFEASLRVERIEGSAVGSLWARAHVADLEREQHWGEREDVKADILTTALEYRLITRYTSFVAVERRVANRTGQTRRVDQPVDIPEGMTYATSVSRTYTPPGDPLLTVDAPRSSRSVIAVYPWGEAVAMQWDELRQRWYDRFLVPRDVSDGAIEILIFVYSSDGSVNRRMVPMVVDSAADEFNAWVEVFNGQTRLTLVPEEPLRSILAQPVGRPELQKRLNVVVDQDDEYTIEFPGTWDTVEVVVTDRAMNTRVQKVKR